MIEKITTYKELYDEFASEDIYNEIIPLNKEVQIETPSGWVNILGLMKKKGKGVKITTENNRVFHGEEKHLIMSSDGWVYLKDVENVLTTDNTVEYVKSKEYTDEIEFYDISIPPPHTYYSPNGLIHHNTFVVTDTIQKEGLTKGKDWIIIKGKITTSALYSTLFMHRKGTLIVFDDADSVWGDQDAANILKAALDSYDERIISWVSPRTVNVSKMTPDERRAYNNDIDDRMADDPESTKIKLPSEFEYKGRIIFISNMSQDKMDSAVLNRSAKIDMTLTQEQIYDRMRSILPHLGDKSVPIEIKNEILDVVINQGRAGKLEAPSMRTYVGAEDIYKSGDPDWRSYLQYI